MKVENQALRDVDSDVQPEATCGTNHQLQRIENELEIAGTKDKSLFLVFWLVESVQPRVVDRGRLSSVGI